LWPIESDSSSERRSWTSNELLLLEAGWN